MNADERKTESPERKGSGIFVSKGVLTPLFLVSQVLGCSGYAGPRSVVNEDPTVKIPEIRKAVDRDDQSVIPQLISDLDSDDPAVRLYAIGALRRLTGNAIDYDWTQTDRVARRLAIEKWRAYVESNPK